MTTPTYRCCQCGWTSSWSECFVPEVPASWGPRLPGESGRVICQDCDDWNTGKAQAELAFELEAEGRSLEARESPWERARGRG